MFPLPPSLQASPCSAPSAPPVPLTDVLTNPKRLEVPLAATAPEAAPGVAAEAAAEAAAEEAAAEAAEEAEERERGPVIQVDLAGRVFRYPPQKAEEAEAEEEAEGIPDVEWLLEYVRKQAALRRCREIQGDIGRYGEIWGDITRYGEI